MEKELQNLTLLCPECGAKIIGRRDKKFCSDQCRTSHFNKIHCDQNNFMRNINNKLRKNRRILKSFFDEGTIQMNRLDLLAEGFTFAYFTNEYTSPSGESVRFCYEFGYIMSSDNLVSIIDKNSDLG
jgi:hypothetical protein